MLCRSEFKNFLTAGWYEESLPVLEVTTCNSTSFGTEIRLEVICSGFGLTASHAAFTLLFNECTNVEKCRSSFSTVAELNLEELYIYFASFM